MKSRTLWLVDRPAPRFFFLYFFPLCVGGFSSYFVFSHIGALLRDFSFQGVLLILAGIASGPLFLYFGLTAWLPRKLLITEDAIYFGGSLALSAGSELHVRGQTTIPLTSSFRFNAKKDGFSKGISFNLQVPTAEGKWTDYCLLVHCARPREVMKRINSSIERMGHSPRELHMSSALAKQLYR